jgi:hypothetical protein
MKPRDVHHMVFKDVEADAYLDIAKVTRNQLGIGHFSNQLPISAVRDQMFPLRLPIRDDLKALDE